MPVAALAGAAAGAAGAAGGAGTALTGSAAAGIGGKAFAKTLGQAVGGQLLGKVAGLAGYGVGKLLGEIGPGAKAERLQRRKDRALARQVGTSDKERIDAQRTAEGSIQQVGSEKRKMIGDMLRGRGQGVQSGLVAEQVAEMSDIDAGGITSAAMGQAEAKHEAVARNAARDAQRKAEIMAVMGVGKDPSAQQTITAQRLVPALTDTPGEASLRQVAHDQAVLAAQQAAATG